MTTLCTKKIKFYMQLFFEKLKCFLRRNFDSRLKKKREKFFGAILKLLVAIKKLVIQVPYILIV